MLWLRCTDLELWVTVVSHALKRICACVTHAFISFADDFIRAVTLRAAWGRLVSAIWIWCASLIAVEEVATHLINATSRHALEAKSTHISVLFASMQTDSRVSAAEVRAAVCRMLTVIIRITESKLILDSSITTLIIIVCLSALIYCSLTVFVFICVVFGIWIDYNSLRAIVFWVASISLRCRICCWLVVFITICLLIFFRLISRAISLFRSIRRALVTWRLIWCTLILFWGICRVFSLFRSVNWGASSLSILLSCLFFLRRVVNLLLPISCLILSYLSFFFLLFTTAILRFSILNFASILLTIVSDILLFCRLLSLIDFFAGRLISLSASIYRSGGCLISWILVLWMVVNLTSCLFTTNSISFWWAFLFLFRIGLDACLITFFSFFLRSVVCYLGCIFCFLILWCCWVFCVSTTLLILSVCICIRCIRVSLVSIGRWNYLGICGVLGFLQTIWLFWLILLASCFIHFFCGMCWLLFIFLGILNFCWGVSCWLVVSHLILSLFWLFDLSCLGLIILLSVVVNFFLLLFAVKWSVSIFRINDFLIIFSFLGLFSRFTILMRIFNWLSYLLLARGAFSWLRSVGHCLILNIISAATCWLSLIVGIRLIIDLRGWLFIDGLWYGGITTLILMGVLALLNLLIWVVNFGVNLLIATAISYSLSLVIWCINLSRWSSIFCLIFWCRRASILRTFFFFHQLWLSAIISCFVSYNLALIVPGATRIIIDTNDLLNDIVKRGLSNDAVVLSERCFIDDIIDFFWSPTSCIFSTLNRGVLHLKIWLCAFVRNSLVTFRLLRLICKIC